MNLEKTIVYLKKVNINLNIIPTLSRSVEVKKKVLSVPNGLLIVARNHTEEMNVRTLISSLAFRNENVTISTKFSKPNSDLKEVLLLHPIPNFDTFKTMITPLENNDVPIILSIIIKTTRMLSDDARFIIEFIKRHRGVYTKTTLPRALKGARNVSRINKNASRYNFTLWSERELKFALEFLVSNGNIASIDGHLYTYPLHKSELVKMRITLAFEKWMNRIPKLRLERKTTR